MFFVPLGSSPANIKHGQSAKAVITEKCMASVRFGRTCVWGSEDLGFDVDLLVSNCMKIGKSFNLTKLSFLHLKY